MHHKILAAITTAVVACLLGFTTAPTVAQEAEEDSLMALPLKPTKTISFDTDEGTWVSLDVSPDGRSIVFDLVGDLYILPMGGGEARRITSGMGWDCMPVFSPDGSQIAFISDRSGSDNLWVMNVDGTGLRKVTSETDYALSSPEWTPDGENLVARRFGAYPSPENYLTNVPLWIYHVDVGKGFEIYPRKEGNTTNTGATFSPDGNFMYFSSHSGGYAGAEVNNYQVVRLDRSTGESENVTSGYGGGLRPIISPDGNYLVYATRRDVETALRIRDLRTMQEEWLVASMRRDDQEGYAPNDILPGYAFTPDSRSVIFTGGGKIKRVDVETKDVSVIPFNARVEVDAVERLIVQEKIDDGPLQVRQFLWVNQSPDGERITFTAVGKLWVADLDGGNPRRLTDSPLREYAPAFSPDGRWIAYVAQSDTGGAQIVKVRSSGGTPVPVTPPGGGYSSVTWSPDGEKVVYQGRRLASPTCRGCGSAELAWISADGGEAHRILPSGGNSATVIETARDGERVYYVEPGPRGAAVAFGSPPPMHVVSVKMDGTDKRTHAKLSSGAGRIGVSVARPSPDGKWLLLLDRDNAFVMRLTEVGDGVKINLTSPSIPLAQLTDEGANTIGWVDGGQTIAWSFTNHYYRASLETVIRADSMADWEPEDIEVSLTVPRAIPQGTLYLEGARIVTMRGDEVIPEGDILIENNRIVAVGPSSTMDAPADARVMDVRGKTIIPGLVDVHAHPRSGAQMVPDAAWNIANHLAYGVTTTRNPSGSRGTFWWQELIEAGELVGPRLYGTANPLTSTGAPVESYEDALHLARRYNEQGAHSLKQYLQPRRIQRQWFRMAAEEEQINITNEGAGDLKADITMALDGFTAFEHSLSIVPLYKDVIEIVARTGVTYTPTLIVAYGGPGGEGYWRAKWDMHDDAKVRRFTPHQNVDREWRRKTVIVDEDFNFPLIAQGVRDIVRAGGSAGLGSHGNEQGIGAQWEIWMLASGGMTPMEVLRVVTILGAESIGFERDLGSLEPGKLADLLVLDANPLDDIHNTDNIHFVIKNGVVYDGDTLDELWPRQRTFPKFPWAIDDEEFEKLRRR